MQGCICRLLHRSCPPPHRWCPRYSCLALLQPGFFFAIHLIFPGIQVFDTVLHLSDIVANVELCDD